MEYEVLDTEDVPLTDLSDVEEIPPDLEIRPVGEQLGMENMRASLWYFDPGEEIQYHAHSEQEEFFYVLQGEFSLKLGRSGEEEYVEVDEGAFWAAGPKIGHGHRYVGDDQGIVLAIGAPNTDDPGLDPHSLDEDE